VSIALLAALVWAAGGCEDAPVNPVANEPPPAAKPDAPQSPPTVARGRLRFVEGFHLGNELATREGKPMLVFFTAEWCDYCHQMERETFTHDQVAALSERFVCILVDADREGDICRQFQVRGYPTIQFLSPWGSPLNRLMGKKSASQLVVEMHTALQALARQQPTGSTIQ
jgi:thiol:disulfide interchange protein